MNCSSKCQRQPAISLQYVAFIGDWRLVDVIAGERLFNLRLLRMWLHIVDEAEYERSENRKEVSTCLIKAGFFLLFVVF